MMNNFALIVEDDRDLIEIFSLALQGAGFETEAVSNGQKALDRLADITPKVVVLDLHLPDVSGEEILKYIRSEERLDDTRVMLTTADALWGEELREDSDVVLLKPISPGQLRTLASRIAS
jgi:CheY-like chemotaxis protein